MEHPAPQDFVCLVQRHALPDDEPAAQIACQGAYLLAARPRPPNQVLLRLTCQDIEEIIYAKLNWPR